MKLHCCPLRSGAEAQAQHQGIEDHFPKGHRWVEINQTLQVAHHLSCDAVFESYFLINRSSGDLPAATASLNQVGCRPLPDHTTAEFSGC
jgi:hypothetical protein